MAPYRIFKAHKCTNLRLYIDDTADSHDYGVDAYFDHRLELNGQGT